MYARTTYAVGDPAQIEHSIEGLRTEAPKLLADSPGYRSFALFTDRAQGKILIGTWWETESDRTESDAHLGERRTELLTPFADSIAVDNFEVAAYSMTAEAAAAGAMRLGRFMIDPSRMEDMVHAFRDVGLPRFADLYGFCGAAMFLDRTHGYGSVGSLFSDHTTLAASLSGQSAARREVVQRTGLRVICQEEFEVVLLENNPDFPM